MKKTKLAQATLLFFSLWLTLAYSVSAKNIEVMYKYHSMGNSDAIIVLTTFKNNTFSLNLEIINHDSKNDLILYDGIWKLDKNDKIYLNFDPISNKEQNPKLLFINGEGKKMPPYNNVELINDYTVKFNSSDKCIFIWNIKTCKNSTNLVVPQVSKMLIKLNYG